jgi:copper chaperone CopZ
VRPAACRAVASGGVRPDSFLALVAWPLRKDVPCCNERANVPRRLIGVDLTSERSVTELRDLTLDLCSCARSAGSAPVRAALLGCPGIRQVHVDPFVTWSLVTFDPARVSPASIVEHMASAGFEVRLGRLFETDPSGPAPAYLDPRGPCPPAASPRPSERARPSSPD